MLSGNHRHILAECNFPEVVWNLIANHFNLPGFLYMHQKDSPSNWFQALLGESGSREKKKSRIMINSVVAYLEGA
jgi:hypothetical protein